jgi:hypothetical protein
MIPAKTIPVAGAMMRIDEAGAEAGIVPMISRQAHAIASGLGGGGRQSGDRQCRRGGGGDDKFAHISLPEIVEPSFTDIRGNRRPTMKNNL